MYHTTPCNYSVDKTHCQERMMFVSGMPQQTFPMQGMMSPSFGAAPMLMMQQQFLTMMIGMISSLFQGGFGGNLEGLGGGLPGLPNFGAGLANSGANGLAGFLGGPSVGGGGRGPRGAGGAGNFGSAPTQPGGKYTFNVASFNVLGSSHTAPGGNKAEKASGVERMRGAVAAMKKHGVDIAGMQEFQPDQQAAFKRMAPNFGMVGDRDNAIVYNKKKFRLVDKRLFSIPYFGGQKRQMPIAKLEDKATGKQMWVVNIHNPADTKSSPHNAANRAKAIKIEQDLMRKLQATGLPVIFTGDFNDRNSVDRSMDRVGMDSAAPNKARSEIDYIFGSAGVNFSNYTADRGPMANGSSDHPLIVSTATI